MGDCNNSVDPKILKIGDGVVAIDHKGVKKCESVVSNKLRDHIVIKIKGDGDTTLKDCVYKIPINWNFKMIETDFTKEIKDRMKAISIGSKIRFRSNGNDIIGYVVKINPKNYVVECGRPPKGDSVKWNLPKTSSSIVLLK